MDHVTSEQFAESVRAAIGTVNQFYGQIDRLNSLLKAALTSGQDRFTVLGGIPPQPGKRKDARVIRYDYGHLYHVDGTESDEDNDYEGALDEDLDGDEEGKKPRAPKRSIEIFPDQQVLAVRTVLFDPFRPQELEPQILYVGMTDWRCGSKKTTPKGGQPFRLKRYMVSRVLRAFDHRTDVRGGERLSTKATAEARSGRSCAFREKHRSIARSPGVDPGICWKATLYVQLPVDHRRRLRSPIPDLSNYLRPADCCSRGCKQVEFALIEGWGCDRPRLGGIVSWHERRSSHGNFDDSDHGGNLVSATPGHAEWRLLLLTLCPKPI